MTSSLGSRPNFARQGLAYVFSRDELIVEPMFPHVIAACIEQVVVSYPKLKPFAEWGQPARPQRRLTALAASKIGSPLHRRTESR